MDTNTEEFESWAGDLHLTVGRLGEEPDGRTRYAYRIATEEWEYLGDDIRTGVGSDEGAVAMMVSLMSYLQAAAESYAYHGGMGGENSDLFPEHVIEAVDTDEVAMVASMLQEIDRQDGFDVE